MDAGYRGRYAVHEASRVDVLRLLVQHGANVNVTDIEGQTPLHIACRHNNIQILHQLVTEGADCRTVDYLGRSAVHHAALGNSVCVLCFLPRDASAERGDEIACRLSVCL